MKTLINIDIKAFVLSYLATAAWVTCEGDECREFTKDAKEQAKMDCEEFIEKVIDRMGEYQAEALLNTKGNDLTHLAAHDLFLTRNHHGAGFWDKGDIYGEENSLVLTEIAQTMREAYCLHIKGKKSKLIFE